MLQMTFVNCIAILSNYFGGKVKFVLVAKVNKSLTRIFSEKIYECFRINTNASKTWLKYRPRECHLGRKQEVIIVASLCNKGKQNDGVSMHLEFHK